MSETESSSGDVVLDGNGAGTSIPVEENARVAMVSRQSTFALLFAIAAWAVPGLGHLLLRRWGRACVYFGAVGGLAIAGLLLRGNVFPRHSEDPFGTLGFLADAASGAFYYFAHFIETNGPDLSRAAGEYGTRLFAAAGIVNLLGALDAYEIASGRRN